MKASLLIVASIVTALLSFRLTIMYSRQEDDSDSSLFEGSVPADDWFERQRTYPFDQIPNDEYLKALTYVRTQMSSGPSLRGMDWSLAGPTNIEGRITTIAVSPIDPNIVFAGCANGGVWKSTDFCQSWVSVFDNQNTSSIGDLAIDP